MTPEDRLNVLIDVLENVSASHQPFDIERWLTHDTCGTAACAIGYGALDPRLHAEGLELSVQIIDGDNERGSVRTPIYTITEFNELVSRFGKDARVFSYIDYKGYGGFDACARFFNISDEDAEYLFDPDKYDYANVTPENVINRIRAVINGTAYNEID